MADPLQTPKHTVRDLPYPNPRYAWWVVIMLLFAALVAYIDRQIVAIVVDQMKVDLNVGDTEIGWLYGVFAIFYAIAGIPIAWASDNFSRKHIIAAGVFVWSLMTMACGLTKQYSIVFLGRIGVGVGEATLTPASTSLVGDYFPREKIPLALSVLQAGPIVGSGIAFIIGGFVYGLVEGGDPLILPWVGELAPWQQTFLYLGAPGLLLAFVFLTIREPERRPVENVSGTTVDQSSFAAVWAFYRQNLRLVVSHHIGFLCFALLGYAFVFWTVSYFVRVHGLHNSDASQTFGWIFLLAGPLGPIIIAYWAEWISRRGNAAGNIVAPLLGSLIGVVAIMAVQFSPTALIAFVLYVPAMMFVNSPFAMAYASLTVVTPPQMRARVAAVYMLVVSMGMMLGPPVAGFFNEVVFPEPEGVRYSIMSVTLVFGVLGTICLLIARNPYARLVSSTSDS